MFVFRNYTVESLFGEDTAFSGYGDISLIPDKENQLVWFYQVPLNFDLQSQLKEIEITRSKLQFVVASLAPGQSLYVLSLENLFPLRYSDTDTSLQDAVSGFNRLAMDLAATNPAVRFLDFGEFLSKYPAEEWINWRFYFISQMILSPVVAAGFKDWFNQRIAQIRGARKKCLVLDLDNTLWGGVLGEDGVQGIKIGGDYPGNAFLYFQEALVTLSKMGVMLAVCSKNNEADVFEAWNKNPFIKLKSDHISAHRINWDNKADNVRSIAKELNIGLDSMVFVDDNPTERELIRQQLPMVAVPEFPKKPYGLMAFYAKLLDDYFRAYLLTDEDFKKNEQYKANARRNLSQQQFTNLTDFIRSLEIEIDIMCVDEFNLPRIAQMTQKTNQFNLTTRRYTEADINGLIGAGADVYCISVRDRFGDNGITGAMIVNREGSTAKIDTFLLSCRILGKNIESAFFYSIVNKLLEQGVKELQSCYIPTAKNAQVADFYERHGMTLLDEKNGEKYYGMILTKPTVIDDYYTITYK